MRINHNLEIVVYDDKPYFEALLNVNIAYCQTFSDNFGERVGLTFRPMKSHNIELLDEKWMKC